MKTLSKYILIVVYNKIKSSHNQRQKVNFIILQILFKKSSKFRSITLLGVASHLKKYNEPHKISTNYQEILFKNKVNDICW